MKKWFVIHLFSHHLMKMFNDRIYLILEMNRSWIIIANRCSTLFQFDFHLISFHLFKDKRQTREIINQSKIVPNLHSFMRYWKIVWDNEPTSTIKEFLKAFSSIEKFGWFSVDEIFINGNSPNRDISKSNFDFIQHWWKT